MNPFLSFSTEFGVKPASPPLRHKDGGQEKQRVNPPEADKP